MYDKNSNPVKRVLYLYQVLRYGTEKRYTVEKLKELMRNYYNDAIDEKSVKKTIQRDLKVLSDVLTTGELKRQESKGTKAAQYYLTADASIENFSSELALVLVMAKDYLRQYLPHQVYDKVDGFFESAQQQLTANTKLEDWHSRIRFVPTGYNSQIQRYGYETHAIKNIYAALLDDELWLDVVYRKEGQSEQTKYILKPHGIIQHGHKSYLMASKIVGNKSELRTFNMQRFDQAEIVPQRIIVDIDSYDLNQLVEDKEYENAYFEREELEIKLRCEAYLLDELQENQISWDQDIEEIEDGYFTLSASCMITQSILDWLIEKAHSIQVQEPQELFDKVQAHIVAAADYYDTYSVDYEDGDDATIDDYDGAIDTLADCSEDDDETSLLETEDNVDFSVHQMVKPSTTKKQPKFSSFPHLDLLDDVDPDEEKQSVRLIELLNSSAYCRTRGVRISIALGKDILGYPVLTDLVKTPHILIAGVKNSGKTMAIHAMLLSILLKHTPEQVRLILINPKLQEFAHYHDIPHLLTPVINDMDNAMCSLNWCINEMERRYTLMRNLRVRKIGDYNQKVLENDVDLCLPIIVVVIDEFSDLMMQIGKKAEDFINRLAAKSRAAGIHLVLSTQYLSENVMTGLIRANIPARMAFHANNKVESRLILCSSGAEDLSEQGEMLFLSGGIDSEKIKSVFVSDGEIHRVCKVWRNRGEPDYIDAVIVPYNDEGGAVIFERFLSKLERRNRDEY
jgi:predicted DNA-binding transcriptional regulator YafY